MSDLLVAVLVGWVAVSLALPVALLVPRRVAANARARRRIAAQEAELERLRSRLADRREGSLR